MKKNILLYFSIFLLLFNLVGCGNKMTGNVEKHGIGKIYFQSNNFDGGEEYGDTEGACVYENGKVKKLLQYHHLLKVNRDGKKMASVFKGKNNGITITDLTTGEQLFVPTEHLVSTITWFNNDNTKLLYVGYDVMEDKKQIFNIYFVDMAEKKEKQITEYTEMDRRIYFVSLSPANDKILYSVSNINKELSARSLFIQDIESGQLERLPLSTGNATWSPNGDTIVTWAVYRDDEIKETVHHMYVYNIKEKTYSKYPPNGKYLWEQEYTFSPEGKQIAYYRWENNGNKTLWVMNADRTNQRKLIDWKYMIKDLSWTD